MKMIVVIFMKRIKRSTISKIRLDWNKRIERNKKGQGEIPGLTFYASAFGAKSFLITGVFNKMTAPIKVKTSSGSI